MGHTGQGQDSHVVPSIVEMSGGKKSLYDLLEEQRRQGESKLNAKQIEVEKQAQDFMVRVEGVNDHIQRKAQEVHTEIENLAGKLEAERLDRNFFEERKAAEGKRIGQLYWENLQSISSAVQEKVDQVKTELDDRHQAARRAHTSFLRLHENLEKDTPKNYFAQASDHKVDFTQRKQLLEEEARDLEVSVQRLFTQVADQRVHTVDSLEQQIASTRQEATSQSGSLAAEIEGRSKHLKDLLEHFAQQLNLTA